MMSDINGEIGRVQAKQRVAMDAYVKTGFLDSGARDYASRFVDAVYDSSSFRGCLPGHERIEVSGRRNECWEGFNIVEFSYRWQILDSSVRGELTEKMTVPAEAKLGRMTEARASCVTGLFLSKGVLVDWDVSEGVAWVRYEGKLRSPSPESPAGPVQSP